MKTTKSPMHLQRPDPTPLSVSITASLLRPALVAASLACIAGSSALAATTTWSGGSDTLWTTTANWTTGTAAGGSTGTVNTGTAVFNSNTATTVAVDNFRNLEGILFDTANVGAYTLTGGTLQMTGIVSGTPGYASIQSTSSVANSQIINSALVINSANAAGSYGALKIANDATAASNTLTIGGNITGAATGTENKTDTLLLSGANTGNNLVSGVISNGSSTVTLQVVKTGAGNWILSGANTYTQGTLVLGGTLTLSGNSNVAVGTGTSALSVDAGALKINGTVTTGTGSVNINGGTLLIDFSGANATATNLISNTSPLVMTGGTLGLNGSSGKTNAQTFASSTISGGNTISLNQNSATSLSIGLGSLTRNAGSTLNVLMPTSGTVSVSGPTTTGNVAVLNTTAFLTLNSADWATISGGTLSKLPTYATGNASYISTNNVDVTNGDSITGASANTLRFNGASSTLYLSGANTITTGGILVSATGAGSTLSGGTVRAGVGKELVIIDYGSLNVNSVIADSASGASSLTLSGTGTTTISSANTYTGATQISGGLVKVANSAAFGTTGTSTLNAAGGTLDLNGYNLSFGWLTGGTLALGGAGTAGTITNSASSGTATLAIGAGITTTGTGTFTGNITDGANAKTALTKSGAGALILGGSNSYTGDTTVNGGVLRLAFSYGNPSNIISADSKLVLNGATVDLNSSLASTNVANTYTQTFNNIFLQAGDSSIVANRTNNSYITPILGKVTRNIGTTLAVTTAASNVTTQTTSDSNLVNVNGIVGPWLTDWYLSSYLTATTVNGVTLLVKTTSYATNTWATGTNTSLSGTTSVTTGTTNTLIFKGGQTLVNLTGTNVLQAGGILVAYNSSGSSNISGGTLTSGTNELIVIQGNSTLANALTINSVIADSPTSTVALTKSGPGTLYLGGVNTFTGGVYLNSGTIVLNNANALNGNVVTLGNASEATSATVNTYAGVLSLNGNSATVGGLVSSNTTVSPIVENNNATAASLTLNNTGTNSYGGTLRNGAAGGTLSLVKNGAGTQILTGTNTYTGTTRVNEGILQLGGTSALPSMAALTVANSGTLAVNAGGAGQWTTSNISTLLSTGTFSAGSSLGIDTTGGNFTYDSLANTSNGALGLTKLGTNTLTLTGNNSYSGPTSVLKGTLAVSGSLTGGGSLRVASGAAMVNTGKTSALSVNIEANATLTNSGTISGPVAVSGFLKTGGLIDGALTLSGTADLALDSNPGKATVNGDLTLQNGSLLSLRISSATDYDQLTVTSGHSISIDTGSALSLSLDVALLDGQTLTLIDNQGTDLIHGKFTTLYIGGNYVTLNANNTFTYGLQTYELSYTGGSGDNDLILAVAAVPEPSTWAMIVGGLGLLAFGQRKRCRKA